MSEEQNTMVEMESLRTFTLNSTLGHCVPFKARVPRMVPQALVSEAMKAGCVPTDAEKVPFYDALEKSKQEFQGGLRRSVIALAIDALVEKNDSKQFDGAGLPKLAVLNDRVGFEVTKEERLSIFQEYNTLKASGNPLPAHPKAALILQVVGANDRQELMALLPETGLSQKEAEGLQTKDLRALILSQFASLS